MHFVQSFPGGLKVFLLRFRKHDGISASIFRIIQEMGMPRLVSPVNTHTGPSEDMFHIQQCPPGN